MTQYSYNGWPASPNKADINVQPFGDRYGVPFPGGVRGGDPATVLGYVATQLHYRVEPVIAGWLWGYHFRANVNNPSQLSCHASGTAIDFNAPNHPNGSRGTFTNAQVGEIRRILAEVSGAVQWGGDYTGTPDEMHFEIIVNAATLATIAAGLVFPEPEPEPEPLPEWDYDMPIIIGGVDRNSLQVVFGGASLTMKDTASIQALQNAGVPTAQLTARDFDQVATLRPK